MEFAGFAHEVIKKIPFHVWILTESGASSKSGEFLASSLDIHDFRFTLFSRFFFLAASHSSRFAIKNFYTEGEKKSRQKILFCAMSNNTTPVRRRAMPGREKNFLRFFRVLLVLGSRGVEGMRREISS
jgi:hypothetical protein